MSIEGGGSPENFKKLQDFWEKKSGKKEDKKEVKEKKGTEGLRKASGERKEVTTEPKRGDSAKVKEKGREFIAEKEMKVTASTEAPSLRRTMKFRSSEKVRKDADVGKVFEQTVEDSVHPLTEPEKKGPTWEEKGKEKEVIKEGVNIIDDDALASRPRERISTSHPLEDEGALDLEMIEEKPIREEISEADPKMIAEAKDLLAKVISGKGKAEERVTPSVLLFSYRSLFTSEELLMGAAELLKDPDVSSEEKGQLLRFTREWVDSGLYTHEFGKPEVRGAFHSLVNTAREHFPEKDNEAKLLLIRFEGNVNEAAAAKPEPMGKGKGADFNAGLFDRVRQGGAAWGGGIFSRKHHYNHAVSDFANSLSATKGQMMKDFRVNDFLEPTTAKNQAEHPKSWAVIQRSNKVSNAVSQQILDAGLSKQQRGNMIKFYVDVADQLVKNGDYDSAMEILTGLNHNAVTRVSDKPEYVELPKGTAGKLEGLNTLFDPHSSYKNLRSHMKKSKKPGLLPIPVSNKDLTFIQDGNPSRLEGNVNAEKLRLLKKEGSATFNAIQQYKPPAGPVVSEVESFIEESHSKLEQLTDEGAEINDALYHLSYQIRPLPGAIE